MMNPTDVFFLETRLQEVYVEILHLPKANLLIIFFNIVQCAGVLSKITVSSNYRVFLVFQFNCSEIDSLPDVAFVIGGRNFNLSAEYYVQQQVSGYYFQHIAVLAIPISLIAPSRDSSS
jgi:hypothetical protein